VTPSLGRTPDALESYRKAIAMEEGLARRGTVDATKRESLAIAYLDLSAIYRMSGTGQQAVAAARQALEHAQGLSAPVVFRAHSGLSAATSPPENLCWRSRRLDPP
jgi:tetratricopeptide (TPR) repeat protein